MRSPPATIPARMSWIGRSAMGKRPSPPRALHGSRVGAFGRSFPGMGDFLMADEELAARFGVEVVHAGGAEVAALRAAVSEEDIAAEMAGGFRGRREAQRLFRGVPPRNRADCLAVRRWLELTAQMPLRSISWIFPPRWGWTACPLWRRARRWRAALAMPAKGIPSPRRWSVLAARL